MGGRRPIQGTKWLLISKTELISLYTSLRPQESDALHKGEHCDAIGVFRRNPDDTVPQRGSRTFEASAHSQCRPHLASRLNKIVILEVTGVNRLYGLLTRADGYLNGLMTGPHTCPFCPAAP